MKKKNLTKLKVNFQNQKSFNYNTTYYPYGIALKTKWWLGKVKSDGYPSGHPYRFFSITNSRRDVIFLMNSCALSIDIYKNSAFLFNCNQVIFSLKK